MTTLHQSITLAKSEAAPNAAVLTHDVLSNINPKYKLRPYQAEAIQRFVDYYELDQFDRPLQLLYQMATGSGKTLIMASLILYLYKKGYRNFIFFVNSSNIIEKTKDNFCNSNASKYLFAQNITIDGQRLSIAEVQHINQFNDTDIQLYFTTIQGLHSKITNPRENSITVEDFKNNKMVFISDEAHHLNAETKKGKKLDSAEYQLLNSWETTIASMVQTNAENILLEFTATANLNNPLLAAKYNSKLLYDYALKSFRADGYSKQVKLIATPLQPFTMALQAMLLSQYRKQLFASMGLNVKPVILFKSKTIKESIAFYHQFHQALTQLNAEDLHVVHQTTTNEHVKNLLQKLSALSAAAFINSLQIEFAVTKTIVVNSSEETDSNQLLINTLEDDHNPYRAVFAVDKLNEGWDVLNLFDIVRLYPNNSSQKANIVSTCTTEAQLIGRGARYFPFTYGDVFVKDKRKFDDGDATLALTETLYYHCTYEPEYINRLNDTLIAIGIMDSAKDLTGKRNITAKREISSTHKSALKKKYKLSSARKAVFHSIPFLSLGVHVIASAMNSFSFFDFANLKMNFFSLTSREQFINASAYLANIQIQTEYTQAAIELLSPGEKHSIAENILGQMVKDSKEDS